ncbi:rust resistance kinase Lr10-like [Jatropha curcas]|uniref:rust resistance kinase Lr10-like n=1 Tax=Jatropha curcas TaxID=180498 RepID=UPI0009D66BFA|nr:rust resistance kinase Lr10-like [Jatropha curcas]
MAQYESPYTLTGPNNIQLKWSEPATASCEAHGGKYRYQSRDDGHEGETKCFKMTQDGQRMKGASKKLIIPGIGLVLLVIGVFFAGLRHLHRSNKKEKENQARIETFLANYKALTPTRYSYNDLKRITTQFKDKLGQGAYGTVFRGKLSNEIFVAVKILNSSTGNGEEFINEVGTMGRIHHVNVIRLVGFCAEGYQRALVYEFLPNESLEKFIYSNDGDNNNHHSLGWEKLQDIALGIAKGIEYLHQGCDQRILHFNIKPHNILLDHNFTPKISDFGLAKLCSRDQSIVSMTTARGKMGYIAPEVFSRNFGNVSYKSDIYSFGMLLLEMVGGKKKVEVNFENTSQVSFPEWIYDHLDRGEEIRIRIEEEGDTKIVKKLTIVGLWCIQWFPVDRPCMTSVVQMLEGEGDDLAMPPNPFNSTGLNRMEAAMPSGSLLHQQLAVISETE